MAMKSFVANGQAVFYDESNSDPVYLKLGAYSGSKPQKLAIAEMRRSDKYPFGEEPVVLNVCGHELKISEMTDLQIYLELDKLFGSTLLW